LLVYPHPLTHDYYPYHIPILSWSDYRAYLPALLYFSLFAVLVWGIIKRNIWGWMILFFIATLSISSNIVLNVGAFMNERFVFISSLAFAVLLAYVFTGMGGRWKFIAHNTVLGFVLLIALLSAYSFKTLSRNKAWRDDFTLFTTDVKTSVNSAKVNISAGGMLLEKYNAESNEKKKQAYLSQSMNYIYKGLQVHPKYIAGWVLYGNAFLYAEKYSDALKCYQNVLTMAPSNYDAQHNLYSLASTTRKKKMHDIASQAYTFLQSRFPDKLVYRYEYAILMDDMNRWDTALVLLDQVLIEDSTYYRAYNTKAQIYGRRLGKVDEAIRLLLKAKSLSDKDPSVWENLGVAYGIKKEYPQSLEAFFKALELKPGNKSIYTNISHTYYQMGNMEKAKEYRKLAGR